MSAPPLLFYNQLKVDKWRQLSSRMDIMRLAYPKAAQAAVYTLATQVTDVLHKNAPEDTGFLKQSAYVAPTKKSALFGFGAWYATMVNGRKVTFRSGRHPRTNQQFMKRTLEELFPTILPRLATLTQQYIRSGTTIDTVPRHYPPVPIAGDGYLKRRKRAPQQARFVLSRAAGGFAFRRKPRKRKKKAKS